MSEAMSVDQTTSSDEPMEINEDAIRKNKIINEEYKNWKKHSVFLYDFMLARALDWPTLTTQWFPDVQEKPEGHNTHRLLLGTHTTDSKPNYVQIAHVQVPNAEIDPDDYDADRGEIGGYGATKKPVEAKFTIQQKITHPGEVNKARYMPQNPDLIATMCNDGKVLIFDRTKHSLNPSETPEPDMTLPGHKNEGFAMHWHTMREGILATGSNDTTINIWDITKFEKTRNTIKPLRTLRHHSASVNAVEYHWNIPHILASVSDDKTLQIHDMREPAKCKPMVVEDAHADEITGVSFNPGAEVILATSSMDKTVALWDMRNLQVKLHAGEGHKAGVSAIEWHPFVPYVLASAGHDRRLLFWNLSNVGKDQTPEDAEDGPPELMFMHGGHTDMIADFSLNKNDPYLTASAAEDNLMQIWKPSRAIVGEDKANIACKELEKYMYSRKR